MNVKKSKSGSMEPMENAHLINRYRSELGWTIADLGHKIGVSETKMQRYILKGKLSVDNLEKLCRIFNVPVTSFFSADLLPKGLKQEEASHTLNHSDSNLLNEPEGTYHKEPLDKLLVERERTIKILEKQLENARGDIEFLKKQLDKKK